MLNAECSCAAPELAVDVERSCTRCKGFIPFEGVEEFQAWCEELRAKAWQEAEAQPTARCQTCWRGVIHCECERTRYVRDLLHVDNGDQAEQVTGDAAE